MRQEGGCVPCDPGEEWMSYHHGVWEWEFAGVWGNRTDFWSTEERLNPITISFWGKSRITPFILPLLARWFNASTKILDQCTHLSIQILCSNCGEDHASGQFPNCSAKREIDVTLYFYSHYTTNPIHSQWLFMWITFQSGRNARRARCEHRQDTHQNKTAENKGVWEFATPAAGTSRPPAATHELQPVYPGSLWSFNPTNSYSHTIKRSRKPPIL